MKRESQFSQAQIDHFLASIAGRCTAEDRPPQEVIEVRYKGNVNAYVQDMLRYDPETCKYLELVPYRATKAKGSSEGTQSISS